jgi:hypothetical protein
MIFQFKIQIKNIQKPPVWRRVLVRDDITFHNFHQIIQTVFGWQDYHLYRFSELAWKSEPIYKLPDDFDMDFYFDVPPKDSSLTKLSEVFTTPKQTFTYLYDFGDDWFHHIILEAILGEIMMTPICTAGKGACPPEDCGGPWGYSELIETLNDPKHPEHKEMKQWLGMGKKDTWDVNAFDIGSVNAALKQMLI